LLLLVVVLFHIFSERKKFPTNWKILISLIYCLVGEIFPFELENFNPETLASDEFLLHVDSFLFLFFRLHLFIYLLIFGCSEPQLTCSVSSQEERNCSSATVSNHISSLLYPIKFVHREHAPDFKGVPIIRQLRVQARILQKEGDLERPSTMEDLSAQNRWIPW